MPYVNVRGIQLYFEEHGTGPCLIAAHGLLGSIATATVMNGAMLASHGLRVIAYDARGHGRSGYTGRPEDYSWAALAEDLHGLMTALGIERASICGTSMGAGVALMLALAWPAKVERLVLRSPPPFGEDMRPARQRLGLLARMCRCLGVPLTARIVRLLPGNAEQSAAIAAQRRAALLPAIRGLLFDGAPIPVERLSEVQVPTLVLSHPGDALHPVRSGELIRDRIAGASLHVGSAEHWKQHAEEFCELAATFVKSGYAPR